jgi:hypothetical protein
MERPPAAGVNEMVTNSTAAFGIMVSRASGATAAFEAKMKNPGTTIARMPDAAVSP